MPVTFDYPEKNTSIIKVIGVGGGGSNAVTHMFNQGIQGVEFAICNTDNQSMESSDVPIRIQLGPDLTDGRGAGSKPAVGKQACIESIEEIRRFLEDGTRMLFVTAGMGGGTGTGAAPIIAQAAREMDILTVGIVTVPFTFEGRRRASQAVDGINHLKENVDALIIISNDKLRDYYKDLPLSKAFSNADDVLSIAAKGIAEIITVGGKINVDFEDVNYVMRESGVAIIGTATAEGEDRAEKAVVNALNSPLLEDNDIKGAQHILLNILSGTKEITMEETDTITEYVQSAAGYGTDLIWGNGYDEELGEKLKVTVIATGFEANNEFLYDKSQGKVFLPLNGEEEKKSTKEVEIQPEDVDVEHPVNKKKKSNIIDLEPKPKESNWHSYDQPYTSKEEKQKKEIARAQHLEEEKSRIRRLRNQNAGPLKDELLDKYESEAAFRRRGIKLEEVDPANAERTSFMINEDAEVVPKENKYLHKDVD